MKRELFNQCRVTDDDGWTKVTWILQSQAKVGSDCLVRGRKFNIKIVYTPACPLEI